MTRYKNQRIEDEMNRANEEENLEKELQEPATSVEEEQWKKRYADSRRGVSKMQEEHKKEIEELRAEMKRLATQGAMLPASKDELESWRKQYPDFARIHKTLVEEEVETKTAEIKRKLKKLEEREQELEVEKAKNELRKIHPDVDELFSRNSDFFKWLKGEPEEDREIIFNTLNVRMASRIINDYKNSINKSKSKVDEDESDDFKGAAKNVRSSKSEANFNENGDYDFSESQIRRESRKDKQWFEKNEAAINKAASKGRIRMDLSGGAR